MQHTDFTTVLVKLWTYVGKRCPSTALEQRGKGRGACYDASLGY